MPSLFILAGPNGAGKSTLAATLFPEVLGVQEFVNAEAIARGLSPFNPESVAAKASTMLLERVRQLATAGADFGYETNLGSREYTSLIAYCKTKGYSVRLIFVALAHPKLAIARVALRHQMGGLDLHEDYVKSRFRSGLHNFFYLYMPLVDEWLVLDNSTETPCLVAKGGQPPFEKHVYDPVKWTELQKHIR